MINYLTTYLKTLIKNERGQGMVEYALIIALVAILLVAGLGLLKGGVENTFNKIANELN